MFLSGLPARIVQHEIDHLDGILFTDRIKKEDKIFLQQHPSAL
jgi:peptide deformylase